MGVSRFLPAPLLLFPSATIRAGSIASRIAPKGLQQFIRVGEKRVIDSHAGLEILFAAVKLLLLE